MGKFGKLVQPELAEYIEYFYKFSKDQQIKALGIQKTEKANLPSIEPYIWTGIDEESAATLGELYGKSTSGFYSGSVQTTVINSVKKNIFERQLTYDEAAKVLKKDLAKAFKMKGGALESGVIPKGFKGTADAYFKGLSQNSATLARTSSNLNTLQYVGSKYIKIHSVKSSRTCLGCLAMDGTKYKIGEAVNHMTQMINASSLDELKEIQPSFHFKHSGAYSSDKLKEETAKANSMASGAVRLPPFHFRCACYITRG